MNTVNDPHFDEAGYCLDSARTSFVAVPPADLKFYVESSGSMNGFFRPNRATEFKEDVWSVVSNFGNQRVFVLSDNKGMVAKEYSLDDFRQKMNAGGFVSNNETLIPGMLNSILANLDYGHGECCVLISDMKYSPAKQKSMEVLLSQYQTDIRNEIGKYPWISLCLIAATSKYLNASGTPVESMSPYWYVIMGKDENVAFMRNCISTILEEKGTYVESIEAGFDYRSPEYSFGIPVNALQLYGNTTFYSYDTSISDTCKVNMKIDISDYRWAMADEDVFRKMFSVKTTYGSTVEVGKIKINVDNHFNKEFKRKAIAEIELKIHSMLAADSDVIEWGLSHPEHYPSEYFDNIIHAQDEKDLSGAFSVDKFIDGTFNAIQNKWDNVPNRILISKTK
ncbi:MAG: hypothetical protein NC308_03200 [Clostridium sp.]|nr:hypothetical protein [Bacteroides sp.]MCM1197872.1 hypothetical protein [Clostridium sp.]